MKLYAKINAQLVRNVKAQAEKDTMSILKEAGEDFTRQFAVAAVGAALGYHAHYRVCPDRLPQFILAYRGEDCGDKSGSRAKGLQSLLPEFFTGHQ